MEVVYIKEHNNYDLTLGNVYEAKFYKEGWLLIESDDKGNQVLYRDECFKRDWYSAEEASIHALKFCEKHQGWKRICDIENLENLYKTWEGLPDKVKRSWIKAYGGASAKEAWEEFGQKPCKVQYAFISGKGKFYKKVTDVPTYHNLMQIYKTG